ncbi:MAG: hypothetical protein KGJ59_04700, partial [Bacteroidota bacterium]|nr:hypothetical protein [Bacteroidota bacterium]
NISRTVTMKRMIFSFAFLPALFFAPSLFAGNGSPYSRYGVGEPSLFMSTRSEGMGGTGLALLTGNDINLVNPAALAYIGRTQLSADFQYSGRAMNDGTQSTFLSSGNFQNFTVAFPVYHPDNIVCSLGASPFSTVAYSAVDTRSSGLYSYSEEYDGSGGLTDAQFSLSVSPLKDLFLGATTHYIFGALRSRHSLTFTSSSYYSSESDRTVNADGFAFTFGGIYSGIDQVLNFSEKKNLNLGFIFFTGGKLTADDMTTSNYITQQETSATASGTIKIPLGFGIGAAYRVNNQTVLTGDVQYHDWSRYTEFGTHPAELKNSTRFGIGAEWTREHNSTSPYLDDVAYRFGAYINASQLQINGTPINEYFLTAGLTYPVSLAAKLDIGLEYGIRGTTTSGLLRENIFRMTFSLSANELMFIPPETE